MSNTGQKHDKDDVLSLFESSESEFSGFDREDIENSPSRAPNKVKSNVVKITKNQSAANATTSGKKVTKKKTKQTQKNKSVDSGNLIDLDNLNEDSVKKLKDLLGLTNIIPNTTVSSVNSINDDDVPDSDSNHSDMANEIGNCLFNECPQAVSDDDTNDDFSWDLPKLKAPDKGDPISESLATLINTACTKQCQVNNIIEKYKVPANCEFMSAPRVNEEIWGDLMKFRRVQTTDKNLRDIQGLVTAGMIPILSMAKVVQPFISQCPQLKGLISDSLTLLGQAQFQMSIRRRYLLRPSLKTKYSAICNISTPITSYLFGDDVTKELKKCETTVKVGKFFSPNRFPKQGSSYGPMRTPRGRGTYRARPYGGYGNANTYGRPNTLARQPYGQYGHVHSFTNKPTKKSPSSTVTSAPN